jgi:hypothetical protein
MVIVAVAPRRVTLDDYVLGLDDSLHGEAIL